MEKTNSTLCEVCIIRTDDGVRWSEYLEEVLTSPEEDSKVQFGPYDVSVFSIGRDGTVHPINQQPSDDPASTRPTGKFLVVVVTPTLIELLHEHKNLGFYQHDPRRTRKAIFHCGIEPIQLFEMDESGKTLSERFEDYSSWSKYAHDSYDKLINSAAAWIRSANPSIPERKTQNARNSAAKKSDNNDDDDDDDDYIEMNKPPHSDEDKTSSMTSSRHIKDSGSESSSDAGDYIGKDSFRGKRSTFTDGPDTYGIGGEFVRSRMSRNDSKLSRIVDDFLLVPGEAFSEDNTTITVVFKESPLEQNEHPAGPRGEANFKAAIVDKHFTKHVELKWINSTVAYFQAPTHPPDVVQVKITKDNEDLYGPEGADLRYKSSQAVEELVSEVSQIYIHLLSVSLSLIKNSGVSSSSSPGMGSSPSVASSLTLGRRGSSLANPVSHLDKLMSNVFKDSGDMDQFSVRAFEKFFVTHESGDFCAHLPTALHLAAKHNLPNLASVLLELPESRRAMACLNSSRMTPVDIAKTSGHDEVTNVFDEFFKETKDLGHDDNQYLDMEGSKTKIKVTPVESNWTEENGGGGDDDEWLRKGALDKSQVELIDIMDMVKNKDISISEARTMFGVWELRHPERAKKEEVLKTKGIKKVFWNLFGAGSKKSVPETPSRRSRQTHRSSEAGSDEVPAIPPRASPHQDLPQPPRKPREYLSLRDDDDDDLDHMGRIERDDTKHSNRRVNLKSTKQVSIPAVLHPPELHSQSRKSSLPEIEHRRRMNQISKPGLTLASEHQDGYICMNSRGKSKK